MSRVLLVGATGLVGGHVLSRALADDRIDRVVAPTRRPLPTHAKLLNPLVDFAHLPLDAEWWRAESAICALGTTRAKGGWDHHIRTVVDRDYPLKVAQLVRDRGAIRFALTSSMGADPRSRFLYTRTKGELEEALRQIGFPSLTVVRPGLIGGRREAQVSERMAAALLGALAPLLPRRYRISSAIEIARVLVDAAVEGEPGAHFIEAEALVRSAGSYGSRYCRRGEQLVHSSKE